MGDRSESANDILVVSFRSLSSSQNWISNAKYSALTFVPKVLYEQFSRFLNAYFLFLAILERPQISPVDPKTIIIPLCFVVSVAALKELVDDIGRRKRDNEFNSMAIALLDGTSAKSGELRAGSMCVLKKDQVVPCDMVVLQSSEDGVVLVETSNLDGETDLKEKTAICQGRDASVLQNHLEIHVPPPTSLLHSFDAKAKLLNEEIALSAENLILQGCVLKNVDECVAMAVYVGGETKIAKNKKQPEVFFFHCFKYTLTFIFSA